MESFVPPAFAFGPNLAVPVSLSAVEYSLRVDIAQRTIFVTARLEFEVTQTGCPIFDMVPPPVRVRLDGQEIDLARWRVVIPPDALTQLRVLEQSVASGATHQLVIDYQLWDSVAFENGGVRIAFFMTDLMDRGYLERFGPANLEFDQTPVRLHVSLNDDSAGHRVFANGNVVKEEGAAVWHVTYPGYFTCSSCFFHLTNRPFEVHTGVYRSIDDREIPYKVYGASSSALTDAFALVPDAMADMESTFGSYAHEQMLIYFIADEPGGMEYAGAAMTGPAALRHEIAHSWFARGVMPANGNAGWIDEAIATWHGNGFPRSTPSLRPSSRLAGFGSYRRHTPSEAYTSGAGLLAELDHLFANDGGLRPLLARLYQAKKRDLISTELFQAYLAQHTTAHLEPIFARYVYGDNDAAGFPASQSGAAGIAPLGATIMRRPPPRISPKRLRSLL